MSFSLFPAVQSLLMSFLPVGSSATFPDIIQIEKSTMCRKSKSAGSLLNDSHCSGPAVGTTKDSNNRDTKSVANVHHANVNALLIIPKEQRPAIPVRGWNQEVAPREPCYLVELLDQFWEERNVLLPKLKPRVKPKLKPLSTRQWKSPTKEMADKLQRPRFNLSPSKRSISVDSAKKIDQEVIKWKESLRKSLDYDEGQSSEGDGGSGCSSPCSEKHISDCDVDELQGFMDLGFRFRGEETVVSLSETLPALKLYQAVENVSEKILAKNPSRTRSRRYRVHSSRLSTLREAMEGSGEVSPSEILKGVSSPASFVIPVSENDPFHVKEHLRLWARTVATAVRQPC